MKGIIMITVNDIKEKRKAGEKKKPRRLKQKINNVFDVFFEGVRVGKEIEKRNESHRKKELR